MKRRKKKLPPPLILDPLPEDTISEAEAERLNAQGDWSFGFPMPTKSDVKNFEDTMIEKAVKWAKEQGLHLTREQALIAYAFQGKEYKEFHRKLDQYLKERN